MQEDRRAGGKEGKPTMLERTKFINASQIGGIDRYEIADGPGRGVRVLCVNTGAGLRYRVLVDRGFDIDQAFMHQHSLAFLTHGGATRPTRGVDHGEDWQKNWPGGLLSSCGPNNAGPPGMDGNEEVGRHGTHSNSAGVIESIIQPEPRAGRMDMSVTGVVKYGAFYGPWMELRRTIRSRLGENFIEFVDEFVNVGNTAVPHAWLLHMNFGYPLVDAGAVLCFDSPKVEPAGWEESRKRFSAGVDFTTVPGPLEEHRGSACAVAYLYPRGDERGMANVGIVNKRLGLGVRVEYSTKEFPRCGNWQGFGEREYVTALEPMNGTVDGRAADRERGLLDIVGAGEKRVYRYRVEVVREAGELEGLLKLNGSV
jgi:hypothetical protein